jgi:heme A synthase
MPPVAAQAADPEADLPKVTAGTEFLYRVAERFGMPVVILAVVLYWARTDIVQPLLDAHFSVVEKIVTGQERHSDQLESVGRKLDELIRLSSQ